MSLNTLFTGKIKESIQKKEKCPLKKLNFMAGPNKILTDGKNGHFKVVGSHPSLTKGKRCGVHLPRFLPMGITPSPFRDRRRKVAAL